MNMFERNPLSRIPGMDRFVGRASETFEHVHEPLSHDTVRERSYIPEISAKLAESAVRAMGEVAQHIGEYAATSGTLLVPVTENLQKIYEPNIKNDHSVDKGSITRSNFISDARAKVDSSHSVGTGETPTYGGMTKESHKEYIDHLTGDSTDDLVLVA